MSRYFIVRIETGSTDCNLGFNIYSNPGLVLAQVYVGSGQQTLPASNIPYSQLTSSTDFIVLVTNTATSILLYDNCGNCPILTQTIP